MIDYELLVNKVKRVTRDTYSSVRKDCLIFLEENHSEDEKLIIEFLAGEIFYMSGYVDFNKSWKDE